jgi:hypothetical protein
MMITWAGKMGQRLKWAPLAFVYSCFVAVVYTGLILKDLAQYIKLRYRCKYQNWHHIEDDRCVICDRHKFWLGLDRCNADYSDADYNNDYNG